MSRDIKNTRVTMDDVKRVKKVDERMKEKSQMIRGKKTTDGKSR